MTLDVDIKGLQLVVPMDVTHSEGLAAVATVKDVKVVMEPYACINYSHSAISKLATRAVEAKTVSERRQLLEHMFMLPLRISLENVRLCAAVVEPHAGARLLHSEARNAVTRQVGSSLIEPLSISVLVKMSQISADASLPMCFIDVKIPTLHGRLELEQLVKLSRKSPQHKQSRTSNTGQAESSRRVGKRSLQAAISRQSFRAQTGRTPGGATPRSARSLCPSRRLSDASIIDALVQGLPSPAAMDELPSGSMPSRDWLNSSVDAALSLESLQAQSTCSLALDSNTLVAHGRHGAMVGALLTDQSAEFEVHAVKAPYTPPLHAARDLHSPTGLNLKAAEAEEQSASLREVPIQWVDAADESPLQVCSLPANSQTVNAGARHAEAQNDKPSERLSEVETSHDVSGEAISNVCGEAQPILGNALAHAPPDPSAMPKDSNGVQLLSQRPQWRKWLSWRSAAPSEAGAKVSASHGHLVESLTEENEEVDESGRAGAGVEAGVDVPDMPARQPPQSDKNRGRLRGAWGWLRNKVGKSRQAEDHAELLASQSAARLEGSNEGPTRTEPAASKGQRTGAMPYDTGMPGRKQGDVVDELASDCKSKLTSTSAKLSSVSTKRPGAPSPKLTPMAPNAPTPAHPRPSLAFKVAGEAGDANKEAGLSKKDRFKAKLERSLHSLNTLGSAVSSSLFKPVSAADREAALEVEAERKVLAMPSSVRLAAFTEIQAKGGQWPQLSWRQRLQACSDQQISAPLRRINSWTTVDGLVDLDALPRYRDRHRGSFLLDAPSLGNTDHVSPPSDDTVCSSCP
jgi:hypothetical protein